RRVDRTVELAGTGGVHGYPKLATGPDGLLYGSTGDGTIFVLHPDSGEHQALTTGHYVLPHTDGCLYFSRGSEVFQTKIVAADPPAWSADATYAAGDQVTYQDNIYQAQWWTQNQTPGATPWGPW